MVIRTNITGILCKYFLKNFPGRFIVLHLYVFQRQRVLQKTVAGVGLQKFLQFSYMVHYPSIKKSIKYQNVSLWHLYLYTRWLHKQPMNQINLFANEDIS